MRLFKHDDSARTVPDRELPAEEFLGEFPSETGELDQVPAQAKAAPGRRGRLLLLTTVVVALGVAGAVWWQYPSWAAAMSVTGSLRIESDPTDADVTLDGVPRGRTPVMLAVAPGAHALRVSRGTHEEDVTVQVVRGIERVHHISWPESSPTTVSGPDVATGRLNVVAERAGAVILVDGLNRGVSPLVVGDLAPGQHRVEVRQAGIVRRQTVQVQAGATASIVFGGGTPAVTSGWMSVTAAIPLQIFENGRLIGTSEADQIMLPSGTHQLAFRVDPLGFQTTREVTIASGQTARVSVALPSAPLSLNATPWAEVYIDGARVGETPLGNVMLPIGSHQIEFRHPQLGTRRRQATVSLSSEARVAVDMRAP